LKVVALGLVALASNAAAISPWSRGRMHGSDFQVIDPAAIHP
jgi:hypothetical protein